jgi:hypothetical protein
MAEEAYTMRQRSGFFHAVALVFLGFLSIQGVALAASIQHSRYTMSYPDTWSMQQLDEVPDAVWDMIPIDEIPKPLQGMVKDLSPEKPVIQLNGPAGTVVYVVVVKVPSAARSFVEKGIFEDATLDEGEDGLPSGTKGHAVAIGSDDRKYIAGLVMQAPVSVFDQVDQDFQGMVESFAWK